MTWCALLVLHFVWIGITWMNPDLPRASGNPAFHPAPTPVFLANAVRSLAKILAGVGSPLQIVLMYNSQSKPLVLEVEWGWKKGCHGLADLMRECICHGSLTLNCCCFSLLYPGKDYLHGFRATAPFHLSKLTMAKPMVIHPPRSG